MADGIDGGVAAQVGEAYYDTFVIIDLEATCDEDDNPKVRLLTCQGRTGLPLGSGVGARGFVATAGRFSVRGRWTCQSVGWIIRNLLRRRSKRWRPLQWTHSPWLP